MRGKGFEDPRVQGSKAGNTLTNDNKDFMRGNEYEMRLIFLHYQHSGGFWFFT